MILTVDPSAGKAAFTSVAYGYFVGDFGVKMILADPEKQAFVLADEYDRTAAVLNARLLSYVNMDFSGWILRGETELAPLRTALQNAKIETVPTVFYGYPDVWENTSLLLRLLGGEAVPVTETSIPLRAVEDFPAWQAFNTQADVDLYMHMFGFHDTEIDRVVYEESYEFGARVTMTVDMTCWLGCRVEFCFEDLVDVRLKANLPQYSREILDTTFRIGECGGKPRVLWTDACVSDEAMDGSLPDSVDNAIRAGRVKMRVLTDDAPERTIDRNRVE